MPDDKDPSAEDRHPLFEQLGTIDLQRLRYPETVTLIKAMADVAQKDGLLALHNLTEHCGEELFEIGFRLVADGTEVELVELLLGTARATLMHNLETKYRMNLQGILSIQSGDNPVITGRKLDVHVDPGSQHLQRDETVTTEALIRRLRKAPFSSLSFEDVTAAITDMSIIARRDGIFALESVSEALVDEELCYNGVQMAIDGVKPIVLQRLLEGRMKNLLEVHAKRYRLAFEGVMAIQSGDTPDLVERNLWNICSPMANTATTPSRQGTRIFDASDGLPGPDVRSIAQDDEGTLWFGTNAGLTRYDGRVFTPHATEDGLEGNSVWCSLVDTRRRIWFGLRGSGVTCYTRESFLNLSHADGLSGDWVWAIKEDRTGTLWFGTSHWPWGGVSKFDGETWQNFTTDDGLAGGRVRCIAQDNKGDMWFGTYGNGVSRYDGKTWTTFTVQTGLGDDHVLCIHPDQEGHLWFGTFGGVSRYDGDRWITYTMEEGLSGNWITCICQDRRGHLWFGTWGNGVTRYDGLVFQHLTIEDGLSHNSVRHILEDRQGEIWIGTERGITRYQPPDSPPSIKITKVMAGRGSYGRMTSLQIQEWQQPVRIEFDAVSPGTRTDQMAFVYRLRGSSEEWKPTRNRHVEYVDLGVGEYTFEVKAVDQDLVYSVAPACVSITVVHDSRDERIDALERRVRQRTQELQDANTALERANEALEQSNRLILEQTERKSAFLASMSHDLRTPMNAIKGFTSLVIRRIGDNIPDQQRQNLEKVTHASDHLLAMINDLLDLSKIEAGQMEANPEPFEVKALITYCCATVSPLVAEKPDLELRYDVADDIVRANTDQGRLRRMLINLLSNAIKFTDSGRVSVKADQIDGHLVLSVTDTGKGIPADEIDTIFDEYRQVKGSDKEHKGTGLGLSITKQFAELLGGSIHVHSEIGKGSTFTVSVPMAYKAN